MFADRVNLSAEPNVLSKVLKLKKHRGETILDLTQSNPTRCGFRYDSERILDALCRQESLDYAPDPHGLSSARRAIAGYYRKKAVSVAPDAIYLTASTSEAYSLLFKLLGNPDDQVLVPNPGYPLLTYLTRFETLVPVRYPQRYADEKGWYLDLDAIEARITKKTRAVVVVNPNNPTGAYLKPEELRALDDICHRNGMALIIDEVFADYPAGDIPSDLSCVTALCRSLTFLLNGFSKMVALPQVKLAWIVITGATSLCEAAKRDLELLLDFYLSVSSQVQHAVPELINLKGKIQSQIQTRILRNERELRHQLAKTGNCRMLKREGGWYAVVEIVDRWDDDQRAVRLLTLDHTLIHPGYFYDFHRDGFVVLSLLPQEELFCKGISRLVGRFGLTTK